MLWSDPKDEPSEEVRETQAMMRRAGLVLALAMVLGMIVVSLR
ncbi:morphogenic membrane protein MmpB [Streptomyces sp. NPDC004838]